MVVADVAGSGVNFALGAIFYLLGIPAGALLALGHLRAGLCAARNRWGVGLFFTVGGLAVAVNLGLLAYFSSFTYGWHPWVPIAGLWLSGLSSLLWMGRVFGKE